MKKKVNAYIKKGNSKVAWKVFMHIMWQCKTVQDDMQMQR